MPPRVARPVRPCGKSVYGLPPSPFNLPFILGSTEHTFIAIEDPPVCVIDGDPAVRDSLATLISLSGRGVLSFATGGEFLAAVRGRPVSCVICAAELPDTLGVRLFQAVRDDQPAIRFALLLSRTDPAAAAEARSQGVHAVFEKPLVHRRLIRFVQTTGTV